MYYDDLEISFKEPGRRYSCIQRIVKTEYKKDIQVLQSDNDGEYINYEMEQVYQEKSIGNQTSCARTPQQMS